MLLESVSLLRLLLHHMEQPNTALMPNLEALDLWLIQRCNHSRPRRFPFPVKHDISLVADTPPTSMKLEGRQQQFTRQHDVYHKEETC